MLRSNQKSSRATRPLRGRAGLALPLVLAVTLITSVELASLGLYAGHQVGLIRKNETYAKSFYMAEAAVQKAAAQVRLHVDSLATVPDAADVAAMEAVVPQTDGKFVVTNYAIDMGSLTQGQAIQNGNYKGLRADTQRISITAQVRGPAASDPVVTVRQEVQMQQIPVFQFGVFYDNDLEILPGANMTFAGPVHTNQDLYLETSATLTFDSGITAAGSIYHGRKDSSTVATGNIFIKDASATNQNMKLNDGTWLDSAHDDWLLQSQSRWNEKVKSDVHDTQQLTLPLPITENLNTLIKRRAADDSDAEKQQKMDYKAQVRIVDGQILDKNGSALVFDYCSTGGSLASCSSANKVKPITFPSQTFSGTCNSSSHFKDNREGKCMKATEIDMTKLASSPKFQQLVTQNPAGLVFYHSDLRNKNSSTYRDALRIINGATVPSKMTLASENPVYVQGNFNTTSKKNVGIVADAMNILSTAWTDANSTSALSSRTAANTTVNAAVIAGNTETTTGHYNGGFENIHRFLENWSGKTVTFSGSVAVLYNSSLSNGAWGKSEVYNAPNRTWSFDTALSSPTASVPGFPNVINLTRGEWKQDN